MSLDPRLMDEFRAQSLEHLDVIEPLVLQLEKRGRPVEDELNEVFRAIHSAKGAAGFLGLDAVCDLAHAMESLLMRLRDDLGTYRPEMADPLLGGVDALRGMLEDLPDTPEPADPALLAQLLDLAGLAAGESEAGAAVPDVAERIADQERRGRRVLRVAWPQDPEARHDLAERAARYGELVQEDYPEPGSALIGSPLEPDLLASALGLGAGDVSAWAPEGTVAAVDEADSTSPSAADVAVENAAAAASADVDESEFDAMPVSQTVSRFGGDRRAETVRVSVGLLDKLMNLAGELVLGRNQLRQLFEAEVRDPARKAVLQSIDLITSELQEHIMHTRMQPIAVLFDRQPRQARDIARRLGKRVQLEVRGGDVELDRTIVETLADPMSHLIRNALDHGIEDRAGRIARGKPIEGRVELRAYHERGRVVIEVEDDGGGIDPERVRESAVARGVITRDEAQALGAKDTLALIFEAGLSTASSVTEVSGRGVGMDVVHANIQGLGGRIDVESEVGRGSVFRIHLPLTLAIIPSLIVSARGERFAVPQVSVREVVRIRRDSTALDSVRGVEVLRVRGRLLPLLRLDRCLGIEGAELEPPERQNVVVTRSGSQYYGLVVDELHDSEEIVVKPLSSYLADCAWYAGAAILGEGGVAMILDTAALARREQIRFDDATATASDEPVEHVDRRDGRSLVVFANGAEEHFALPLDQLLRLESVERSAVQSIGDRRFLEHRGRAIPLIQLETVLPVRSASEEPEEFFVLIPRVDGVEAGIVATRIVDTLHSTADLDTTQFDCPGVLGSAIVRDHLTLLLDPQALVNSAGVGASTPAPGAEA